MTVSSVAVQQYWLVVSLMTGNTTFLSSQQFLLSRKIGAKHWKRVLFQSDVILVKLWILGKISCSNNFSV